MNSHLPWLAVVIALCSLLAGVALGSVDLPFATVLRALTGHEAGLTADIVWQLRLPRALAAFACGGLLALAGALLQALLRNPLADPYILGISGGSAVAALAAMLLGLAAAAVNLAALGGALGAVGLVFVLGFGRGGNMVRLLLTGVVLSAGFGALISLLLTLAPGGEVRGMLFWLMGDLSQAQAPGPAWAILLAALALAWWQAGSLDILGLGEIKAKSLGVAVRPLQFGIYFTASAATAAVVVEAGAIGFVGLIVPHFVRLLGVAGHRRLLPLAVLAGGSFLTLADTLARTVAAPQQLPVGVLTALLGVPLLLFLLTRKV
ncbi:MAG: iron ABC transporter permease [Sulfuricella sp.]|nr:iron ABC transporter permease [Sulfuricella sp.]